MHASTPHCFSFLINTCVLLSEPAFIIKQSLSHKLYMKTYACYSDQHEYYFRQRGLYVIIIFSDSLDHLHSPDTRSIALPVSTIQWSIRKVCHTLLPYHPQVNTYQTVLATDENATYVLFLYEDIQWSTPDTQVGFNAGDGIRSLNLLESASDLQNLSNVDIPGAFYFRVDLSSILQPGGM